jgi:hypothetical protein
MRRSRLISLLLAALPGALLAACQPLPAPYAPTDQDKLNPLLTLRDATGVWVELPSGLPPDVAQRLAELVAENLRQADVPAAVGIGNRGSAVLRAAGQMYTLGPAEAQLALTWQLIPPGGTPAEWQQRETIPRGANLPPMPRQIERMGKATADKVIPLLAELTPAIPLPEGVVIGKVEGAPGDGNLALSRAIGYSLKQRGVRVVEEQDGKALLVRAMVQVGKPVNLVQAVRIYWGLFMPDGTELGTVTQENDIPAGRLDKNWSEIAVFAAEGAVDGLKPLIDRAPPLNPTTPGTQPDKAPAAPRK